MFYTLEDRCPDEWYRAIDRHLSSSFSAALCFAPAADWHEDGAFTRFVSGLPDPFGNLVWNAHLGEESVDQELKAIAAPIIASNSPAIWIAGPTSEPATIAERLLANGFFAGHPLEAMAVDLAEVADAVIPAGCRIDEVCDDGEMKSWLDVLAVGYELMPEVAANFGYWPRHLGYSSRSHMRAFLAKQNDRPVACSLLYLHDGVAGIYCVATVPDARRQGLGCAITTVPLLEARAAGYRVGVLQSSAMGAPIYRRIGFRDYGPIAMMVRMPAAEGMSG